MEEEVRSEGLNAMPLVSVITINYNGVKYTCDLLSSLKKITYPNYEIIVVDNNSKEDPGEIEIQHPDVKLIRSKENLGFAGGNNVGMMVARGKYFLLLNNDTEVDPDFMHPLVEKLETDPMAGAASSKLIYYNSDNIIQYAGSSRINPFTGRNKTLGNKEKDNGQYDGCCTTCYAHGAAMMIPRKVVEKIGLMAEQYFLYYEELDFCERINAAGYNIWYVGKSVVYHKESMSVGKESPLKAFYMTRNRLIFMRRNFKGIPLFMSFLFFTSIALPKNVFAHLKEGKKELAKEVLKGFVSNFKVQNINDNPKLNIQSI
ncbi:MAG: glycosyltransferase family 2 protein [Cytophagaceae bacterium]